jgi:membrane protease subunit HflK
MAHDHFHFGHEHHDHDHEPDEAVNERLDAANRSLSEALRQSFVLLTGIMILALGALLLTGMTQVQTGQRGVKFLFGRIQGDTPEQAVLGEGLRWSWPEPIGRIEKVNIGERTMTVDDFWYYGRPEDSAGGLRPGFDGALLTGDRGLVHVKVICNYGIRRLHGQFLAAGAEKAAALPGGGADPDPEAVLEFVRNIRDPEEVVRSAVCDAAILAAATRTVDSIIQSDQKSFADAVAEAAQLKLREVNSGLQIRSIRVTDATVPIKAVAAYNDVNAARQEAEAKKNKALGDAVQTLSKAAGGSWRQLVGDSWREIAADHAAPGEPATQPGRGLLYEYELAKTPAEQDKVLAEINAVLLSPETGGSAAMALNEAKSYSSAVRNQMEARAGYFEQVADSFKDNPELMVQNLWAGVQQEILSSPFVDKFRLSPGQKVVLRLTQDPKVLQKIRDIQDMLKGQMKNQAGAPGRNGR